MTVANVRKLVVRAGVTAKIAFPVHLHMLRHACGFKLANDGQDTRAIQVYLGHPPAVRDVPLFVRALSKGLGGAVECEGDPRGEEP